MTDNHPAKIAKYLLKGWCLLNENCPAGTNIPLVRSREGVLVCCGCTPACPHYRTYGDPPPAGQAQELLPASVEQPSDKIAPVLAAPAAAAAAPAGPAVAQDRSLPVGGDRGSGDGGGCCGSITGATGVAASSGRSTAIGANPMAAWQDTRQSYHDDAAPFVSLQTPPMRFSCVRLSRVTAGKGGGRRFRLVGDSLMLKVRFALPAAALSGFPEEEELRVAVQFHRDLLHEKVIVPSSSAVSQPGREQVSVNCEDGSRFSFPERDCLLIPAPQATLDAIAAVLWEGIVAGEGARFAATTWMEVCLVDGSGAETTFRRALPQRKPSAAGPVDGGCAGGGGSSNLAKMATDW
eukprot:TRINITY_DN4761_c0_g1_i1.p1 TRINITY_DN4761_c0_g1~~TRINITY_DN4761_c0_g1_i1.p1  ORF type:complete len:350 (-),score=72.01 TRINITY_DN4761_c0_g1_i1:258-1307(-)